MKNTKKIFWVILPILFGLAVLCLRIWAQESCVEHEGYFSENFDLVTYKDMDQTSVANWPSGPISLNYLGANFQVTEPTGMGARIYVCDAGDFDGDGYPDLIGLDIGTDYRLILIRNQFEDNNGDGIDDDGIIFQIDTSEIYDDGLYVGPASITTGDYNKDGLMDFFFMKNRTDQFGYTEFVAAMYINTGTATDPHFSRYYESSTLNFSSKFMDAGIYINWAADHLCSVDIDLDGDTDVLAISQDKVFLVRNPGPDNFSLDNFVISELNYDQTTGFTTGRGGSSIDAGDFDKDGDIDVIGGSVNDYDYLVYYVNDGTGNFTRNELVIPNSNCTGTVATCVADFNQDSTIDIFAATDRWNAGNEARMWLLLNNGVIGEEEPEIQFEFRCLNNCDPILPDPHDVDMSSSLDFDQDGDMDVILADANHSGDYFLVINEVAPVYTLLGEARSLNIAGELDTDVYAVTKVKVNRLQMQTIGGSNEGLAVELYVSNNGSKWELYQRFEENEIRNQNDLDLYTFNQYGTNLYWKALLYASEDSMAEYSGASFETPLIHMIELEYIYVERREYSRTSVAASFFDDENERIELIIAGSFYYPGWQGQLRSYDLTEMAPLDVSYSNIRTITRPDLASDSGREIVAEGVDIYWDAGQLLDDRSASNRTIYTAVQDGAGLSRMDFSILNVSTLAPILQDVNNDNEGLIEFVRGDGRDWKLGDINHSNPVIIGPPDEDAALMGEGYVEFAEAWSDRPLYLYVGANDGMIHCFNVKTGEEHWAFIPYNLIPKLRNMWAVDPLNQDRYFVRDAYVDGSPATADVYIDADGDGNMEWRTVIVCGQGPGQGSTVAGGTTGNFYFALDVTDPDDPQPLWEFTDEKLGETWSIPVFGKVVKNGNDTWVCFMGSGYDNVVGQMRQGHRFYSLTVEDGVAFWFKNITEVNTKKKWPNEKNVIRSIPGSPAIIDIDSDSFADAVYFGDLEGRMWKIDVTIPWKKQGSWKLDELYEDSNNYPIITKPAIWVMSSSGSLYPRIYFGTGGDDNAPSDGLYSFVCVIDDGNGEVEWYMGDSDELGLAANKDAGDFSPGEKIWADPKIANYIVFFSSLFGSIESVDPCENLAGEGKLYGRFVEAIAGSTIGGTAFTGQGGNPTESLDLEIKTRSAVTLGESERTASGARKKEVYIQEYDSTIQKLEQSVGAVLKVKSWREVYKVIK